jgi:hypothetical protein
MISSNILYTPLDTPEVPDFDVDKLLDWISLNNNRQDIDHRKDSSKIKLLEKSYPWNIVYARYGNKWQYGFNTEFLELSNFFSSAFGLDENDIHSVVLLPVKTKFAGIGFWHSDPDVYGLRMYLENQETDEFLLIRPTVEPYDVRPNFGNGPTFENIPLQDKIFSAKLRNHKQTFYLNNTRAIHAVKSCYPGTLRIATIIAVNNLNVTKHINDLIHRSAKKYPDYAIYWQPT